MGRRLGPVIDARALHKHFGEKHVLKGVDLRVAEREMVCIIGPQGAGKSTLLHCLARIETPDSGTLVVDGVNLMEPHLDLAYARQHIGMVLSAFDLHQQMSALGNVTQPLHERPGCHAEEAEVLGRAALARVGLADRAGLKPYQLSCGQQLRVAIARALVLEPRVMLFDEPTSTLHPDLVGGVLALLRELRQDGMAVVVVSHEMRFARALADRVVFMDQGCIVEQGLPAAMFEAPAHARTRAFMGLGRH
jgi:ABC-type polar amino acid transport system ATPase subunit